jgi:hypothetical protein
MVVFQIENSGRLAARTRADSNAPSFYVVPRECVHHLDADSTAAAQSAPTTAELLQRAGAYVRRLENQLATVIGNEKYQQTRWEMDRRTS